MTPATIPGQCLCGAFRFEITGPLGEVRLCHCDWCRRANGAAFSANARVPIESHRAISGKEGRNVAIQARDDAARGCRPRRNMGWLGWISRAPEASPDAARGAARVAPKEATLARVPAVVRLSLLGMVTLAMAAAAQPPSQLPSPPSAAPPQGNVPGAPATVPAPPEPPVPSNPRPMEPAPPTSAPPTSAPANAEPAAAAPTTAAPTAPPVVPAEQVAPVELTGMLGQDVLGPEGAHLGNIVDALADSQGHLRAVVIDVGGFMGVGNRKVAIAWTALSFTASGKGPVISVVIPADRIKSWAEYIPGRPVAILGASGAH
jgi:hypothetical protein